MKRHFSLSKLCVAVLLLCPMVANAANTAADNQAGADRVALTLAQIFPQTDIAVRYQDGQVWLSGEVATAVEVYQILDNAAKINGVARVHNELTTRNGVLQIPTPAAVANHTGSIPTRVSQAPAPMAQVSTTTTRYNGMVGPSQRVMQVPNRVANAPNQRAMPVGYMTPKGVVPVSGYSDGYAGISAPMEFQQSPGPQMAAPCAAMPGQYAQPNMPSYAWPSYACYPNYAEVTYPKQYSHKAWPFIGPFYPYPKVPAEWRKVTMEYHDGWWWLDFDDSSNPRGPFSSLFRQP